MAPSILYESGRECSGLGWCESGMKRWGEEICVV
jgi:hypothetical protein